MGSPSPLRAIDTDTDKSKKENFCAQKTVFYLKTSVDKKKVRVKSILVYITENGFLQGKKKVKVYKKYIRYIGYMHFNCLYTPAGPIYIYIYTFIFNSPYYAK